MGWQLVTPPTSEPVTEAEFRATAHVEPADETSEVVMGYLARARAYAEHVSCRAIAPAVYRQYFRSFVDEMTLYKPPLIAVQSIRYRNLDGLQTLDAAGYAIDNVSEPGRITLPESATWPATLNQANAVEVLFLAGYEVLPQELRMVILGLARCEYDKISPPKHLVALLEEYRHGALTVGD